MAGTTHYRYFFKSDSGETWRVTIYDTTYTDNINYATIYPDSSGFKLGWEGAGADYYTPIIKSQISLVLHNDINSQALLNSIVEGIECQFIIIVSKLESGFYNRKWRGIVNQDSIILPDSAYNVDYLTIDGSDGFGLLESVNYTGYNPDTYKTIVDFIQECLFNIIPKLQIASFDAFNVTNITTASNWFATGMVQDYLIDGNAGDPLKNTLLDELAFVEVDEYGIEKGLSYLTILENILQSSNLQISQWNGTFLIIQQESYKYQNIRAWNYDTDGNLINTELLSLRDLNMPARKTGGEFTHILPVKEITTLYDYKRSIHPNNLLPNNVNPGTEYAAGRIADGDIFVFSGTINLQFTSSINASIIYVAYFKITIKTTLAGVTYYLKDATNPTPELLYEWSLTPNTATLSPQNLINQRIGLNSYDIPFSVNLPAANLGDLTLKWEFLHFDSPSGYLSNIPSTTGLVIDDVETTFKLNLVGGVPMDGTQLHRASITNGAKSNIELTNTLIGDGVMSNSRGALYYNNNAGDILNTETWFNSGVSAMPLHSLRCFDMLMKRKFTAQCFSGELIGEPNIHKCYYWQSRYWFFQSLEWDCANNSFFVTLIKYNGSSDGITVDTPAIQISNDATGGGGGGSTSSVPPITTHDRLHNLFSENDHTGTGGTEKTSIVDADSTVIIDSQDSSKIKRFTWARVKAFMLAYLEPFWLQAQTIFPVDINRFGFLNQTQTSLIFDGTSRILMLQANSTTWSYYRAGIKYTITGNKTVTIPAVNGFYFIYIDGTSGDLIYSTVPWTLNDTKVPVCTVAYNSTLTPVYHLADERHSCLIDRRTHMYEHLTEGTKYISGAALSGYTLATDTDTAKTFGISAAVIADEDIFLSLPELLDPNGTTATYIQAYKSSGVWVWAYSAMPFKYVTNGYIQWNNNGVMTEGGNAKYYNTYLFLSDVSGDGRFIIISGQGEFANASSAYAETFGTFNLTGLWAAEGIALYQFTWSASASNNSKGKVKLDRVQRISTNIVSTNSSTTNIQKPWDIEVDSTGIAPIYETGSVNVYKGLRLISGNAMQLTPAGAVDSFLGVTIDHETPGWDLEINTQPAVQILDSGDTGDGTTNFSGLKINAQSGIDIEPENVGGVLNLNFRILTDYIKSLCPRVVYANMLTNEVKNATETIGTYTVPANTFTADKGEYFEIEIFGELKGAGNKTITLGYGTTLYSQSIDDISIFRLKIKVIHQQTYLLISFHWIYPLAYNDILITSTVTRNTDKALYVEATSPNTTDYFTIYGVTYTFYPGV